MTLSESYIKTRLRMKRDVPNFSKDELLTVLNEHGFVLGAKFVHCSKPTIAKAIKFHGIKRVSKYE